MVARRFLFSFSNKFPDLNFASHFMVFLTVQYNGTDRNSYFAGTDQGLGRLGGIVGSFLTV